MLEIDIAVQNIPHGERGAVNKFLTGIKNPICITIQEKNAVLRLVRNPDGNLVRGGVSIRNIKVRIA